MLLTCMSSSLTSMPTTNFTCSMQWRLFRFGPTVSPKSVQQFIWHERKSSKHMVRSKRQCQTQESTFLADTDPSHPTNDLPNCLLSNQQILASLLLSLSLSLFCTSFLNSKSLSYSKLLSQ